jgi:hypothetical protein
MAYKMLAEILKMQNIVDGFFVWRDGFGPVWRHHRPVEFL